MSRLCPKHTNNEPRIKHQFTLQDVGVLADCERTVQESIDGLGGLDIIISNAVSATAFCPR